MAMDALSQVAGVMHFPDRGLPSGNGLNANWARPQPQQGDVL